MINATLSLDGLIVIVAVTFAIILTFYCTRLWLFRSKRITTADVGLHFAFAANLVEMALCCCLFVLEKQVRSHFETELDVEKALVDKRFLKYVYTQYPVYLIELWSLKVAYLGYFFYLRIHLSRFNQWLYRFTCVYTVAGFITLLVYCLARCRPVSKNWTSIEGTEGFCIAASTIDMNAVLLFMNLSNDLLILFLGLHIIYGLVMSPQSKAALFTNAGLGFLSIVMGGVRFLCVYATLQNPQNGYVQQLHLVLGVGALEVTLAFMAFCLPSFRVLWSRRRARSRNSGKKHTTGPAKSDQMALETIGGSGRPGIHVERTVELRIEDNCSRTELCAPDRIRH